MNKTGAFAVLLLALLMIPMIAHAQIATIAPSPATFDVGQAQLLTGTWTSTNAPYTANWIISQGNAIIANQLESGITGTANTFTPSLSLGAYNATLYITDNSLATFNSIVSSILVNPALIAGKPTTANAVIDNGQVATLVSHTSSGTAPLSYQWYSSTGASCSSSNTALGATSTITNTPTANTLFCYVVTDNAVTPTNALSSDILVTVNPFPSALLANVPSTIDSGQSLLITGSVTGGTSTYTYEFYTGASTNNCAGDSSNVLATFSGQGLSNSLTISPLTTNSYCVGVTDSANTAVTINSIAGIVTVNSVLSASAPTPLLTAIANGQSITLTSHASGGTPPYIYSWYTANAICGSLTLITGSSNIILVSPSSSTYYCYKVMDSSLSPATVTSSAPANIIVSSAVSAINPTNAFQYVSTRFQLNVTQGITPINTITWSFNGTVVYTDNVGISSNILIGAFNFTKPPYNSTGVIVVTANILNATGGTLIVTDNVLYKQYVLPSITSLSPNATTQNAVTVYGASVSAGSFPVNTIVWDFNSHYFTNVAFNGSNFQSYMFNTSGSFSYISQICDVNNFCSSKTQYVRVASTNPASYWTVKNATVSGQKGKNSNTIVLQYPQTASMTLYFIPHNDTNLISTVTINWGDSTPSLQYTYSSGVTQAAYQHLFATTGIYSINATICDTVGNCHQSFIVNITYQQTIYGQISGILFNGNSNITISKLLNNPVVSTAVYLIIFLIAIGVGALFFIVFGIEAIKRAFR